MKINLNIGLTNQPGVILVLIEHSSGSRKDLTLEGAAAVYPNRRYCMQPNQEEAATGEAASIESVAADCE